MKLNLDIERLEARIAPGGICHEKGNNGWGNGGDDGVPGNSTANDNSQTDSKAADECR